MRKVALYYPNNWRRYIGNLASKEEKEFNWFLCSKKYKDPKSGYWVVEIARGVKFYEEETGKTLVIPLVEKEDKEKILLLVDDGLDSDFSPELLNHYGYKGVARLTKCNLGEEAIGENPVCKEAIFEFLPGVLEDTRKEANCPIIEFSKRNYPCIKKKIPDFPTPEEIEDVLGEYSCNVVCQVLYEYIYLYLKRM